MLVELTSLARKLRELRAARLLTQEELAEQSGVSPAAIRNIEHGRATHPRRKTMESLARVLGINALDLADDTLSTREVLRRAEREDG